MESGGQAIALGKGQMHPVFRGLAEAKFAGTKAAKIVGVAPPTYSKWRTGRTSIPAAKLVFLTLLLANRIEELEVDILESGLRNPRIGVILKSIHRHLHEQEKINCTLHPAALREGAGLFRRWWQENLGELTAEHGQASFDVLSHTAIDLVRLAVTEGVRAPS